MPPGITPPAIIQFNASNVPVAQLTVCSKTLSEQQLFDYGLNFIRVRLFTIPGLATPAPFGGKQRQIMVDIDPARRWRPRGSRRTTWSRRVLQRERHRAGRHRRRSAAPSTTCSSTPAPTIVDAVQRAFRSRWWTGPPVLLGDVAHVRDGFAVQNNIVRTSTARARDLPRHPEEGRRLDAGGGRRARASCCPSSRRRRRRGSSSSIDFDQSVFVRARHPERAARGGHRLDPGLADDPLLPRELAQCDGHRLHLDPAGDPRRASIGLFLTGAHAQPHDARRPGAGHRHAGRRRHRRGGEHPPQPRAGQAADRRHPRRRAADRDRRRSRRRSPSASSSSRWCCSTGRRGSCSPRWRSAVVFSMLASYLLSRTLVPTLARMLMATEHAAPSPRAAAASRALQPLARPRLRAGSRTRTAASLARSLAPPALVLGLRRAWCWPVTSALPFVVGTRLLPRRWTPGMMRLHFRAPIGHAHRGDREAGGAASRSASARSSPPSELATINDNIGLPISYNLAFVQTDNIGSQDAEILIALKPSTRPTERLHASGSARAARRVPRSRALLPARRHRHPGAQLRPAARRSTCRSRARPGGGLRRRAQAAATIRAIPGAVDVRIPQVLDLPDAARRRRPARARRSSGITERDVANNLLISLASQLAGRARRSGSIRRTT